MPRWLALFLFLQLVFCLSSLCQMLQCPHIKACCRWAMLFVWSPACLPSCCVHCAGRQCGTCPACPEPPARSPFRSQFSSSPRFWHRNRPVFHPTKCRPAALCQHQICSSCLLESRKWPVCKHAPGCQQPSTCIQRWSVCQGGVSGFGSNGSGHWRAIAGAVGSAAAIAHSLSSRLYHFDSIWVQAGPRSVNDSSRLCNFRISLRPKPHSR